MKKLHFLLVIVVTAAVSLLVIVGSAGVWWMKFHVPRLRENTDQRWAEIGRPMPKFERQLNNVAENSSFRALARELEPFGIFSLYRARAGEPNPNTTRIPNEITDILKAPTLENGDCISLPSHLAYLDKHAADLARLYLGILDREPAVWSLAPHDGMALRVPSYLAAREISQVICVDALMKIDHGHDQQAAMAVTAGLKLSANIGEQPILLSQMIRVAIEALFAEATARLPEDPDALNQLAADVKRQRERWREAIQCETWAVMRTVDYLGLKPAEFEQAYRSRFALSKASVSLKRSFLQADYAVFAASAAEQISASERVGDLALSDLGCQQMTEATARSAPTLTNESVFGSLAEMFRPQWAKSWIRLNASLLLREQAEIIRSARSQVRAGRSGLVSQSKSVVVPGATWHVAANAGHDSISVRLVPVPPWTQDRDIIGDNFFLLPLDGSRPWKLKTESFKRRSIGMAGN